ncbi:hypothetical protein N7535_008841 [Penicillium sp. DV-2018c]|nr:hypothetical protein N7461_002596 [Penicillium sp. DV-2018c]KAJ5563677.1 hypothetical protein N7535_008841 [Penicillium sp. DV-2018c]
MNIRKTAKAQSQSPKVDTPTSTPQSQASDSQSRPRSRTTRNKSANGSETKARRVRTGCLTCRQRHLKCDEAVGRCLNCRKSDRICQRGVRLNFIDTQSVAPPHIVARPQGSKVTFRDDSRLIADLYVGGSEIYPPVQPESPVEENDQTQNGFDIMGSHDLTSLFQSVAASFDPLDFDVPHPTTADFVGTDTWHQPHMVPGDELLPQGTSNFARNLAGRRQHNTSLTDPEHVFLLRTFAEEVGPRMDIMDEMNHFSQILPGFAVDEPMLLNAFLACGARHRSVVDSSYAHKASYYYDEATRQLLTAMHHPDRDSVLCATAALVLGFFETMSSHSTHGGQHSTGSRALIRECGWTAKTPGLGGACFRISVSAELLNCMRRNWILAWDPDSWGVNMQMCHEPDTHESRQDTWYHRILYIFAKVVALWASRPSQGFGGDKSGAAMEFEEREWARYNSWCMQWADSVPRSLVPLGYLSQWPTNSGFFPEILFTQRSAIVARLFYYATRILLAKTNLSTSESDKETRIKQRNHAYDICGLIAHTKDRGISDISIQFLTLAAEYIDIREAQSEVLEIVDRIAKVAGINAELIKYELKQIWHWRESPPGTVDPAQMHNDPYSSYTYQFTEHGETSPTLNNPLLTRGDFGLEDHPYQGFYVRPFHAYGSVHQM